MRFRRNLPQNAANRRQNPIRIYIRIRKGIRIYYCTEAAVKFRKEKQAAEHLLNGPEKEDCDWT